MSELFYSKEEISREEFFDRWRCSESSRDSIDQSTRDLMAELKRRNPRHYVVTLSECGFNRLILPYHVHPSEKVRVRQGGEPFWEVVSRYSDLFRTGECDDCLQRVSGIKERVIGHQFRSGNLIKAKFVFASNDRGLVAKQGYRDHGSVKLYAGNIHQFIAYGVWLRENDYSPKSHRMIVYYCEKST